MTYEKYIAHLKVTKVALFYCFLLLFLLKTQNEENLNPGRKQKLKTTF